MAFPKCYFAPTRCEITVDYTYSYSHLFIPDPKAPASTGTGSAVRHSSVLID